jgi:lipopolysaccharide exporter
MSVTEAPSGLSRAMAVGSLWMIASRWAVRSIGLVSTVVLVRLLTPEDFGLVAMAMLVIGAIEVLGETGQRLALIRMREPTREHYDTAWTFSVLMGCAIAAVLAAAAPFVARVFDDPRVTSIMWCLALRPLIGGFQNIGLIDLQRRLDFRRDQQVVLSAKLASFLVTVFLAVLLQSYWALIGGILVQATALLVFSYVFSPFRPRFGLPRLRELWSFSVWTLVTHLSQYLSDRIDQGAVGLALGAPAMGKYAIANDLASMPTEELVYPPARALYAVYARVSSDSAAMREYYMRALSFIVILACATGTGIALVAEDAVRVILGQNWLDAIPLLPWLALASALLGVARTATTVLIAAGHALSNALQSMLFAALLVPTAWLGIHMAGTEGVAVARFAVTVAITPLMFAMLMRRLQVRPTALVASCWRPVAAATAMAAAVTAAHPAMPPLPPLRLCLEAALGASVYGASLLVCWLCSGRPPGPESTALVNLKAQVRRFLK